MRKTLNRVLACFLSVALLVSCCISGLVLPATASTVGQNLITNGDFEGAEWTDAKYVSGEGFGNSKAFKVTDNYTILQNDFTLSQALDTNKWYVVRFKAKGGLAKLYDSINSFMSMNPANAKQDGMDYTQGWIQYQLTPFKPTSALTVIDTADLNFYVSVDNSATMYFDDFEIIEYVPGMNVITGGDGSMLPFTWTSAYTRDVFYNVAKNMSLVEDNGNAVWKFSNLDNYHSKNLHLTAVESLLSGKEFTISFRYKTSAGSVSTNFSGGTTVDDPNNAGWKIYSVTVDDTADTLDFKWGVYLTFSGTTEALVDDFTIAEPAPEVIPTIDITEATATVEEGKTVTLNATVTPADKAVEWTSSDNTIATVVDGVVTGVKAGEVTITAKVADGITDTCTVTVTAKPVTPPPSVQGQNLITNGDFEGAEWTDAKYVSGEGFGNSKAFKVTGNYTILQNDFTLSQALDTNKWYVVRFKAKGGLAKLYDSINSFMSMNPANAKQDGMDYTQGWIQYQLTPFKPTSALTVIDTADLNFYVSVDNSATMYFDDFEIIEYAPGMNVITGGDGSMLPFTWTSAYVRDVFYNVAKNMSLVEDNGNAVWKFSNLENYHSQNLHLTAVESLLSGKEFTISFRYKTSAGSVSTNFSGGTTVDDPNNAGWKIYSVTVDDTADTLDFKWGVYLIFSGTTEALVDDFTIAEPASEVTPTIDITEATATVEEEATVTLNATVTPDGTAIEWTSSDDTIATVVDGVVTGVKAGEVTITAKVADGITDTCTVTVTAKPVTPPPSVQGQNLITDGDFEADKWTGSKYASGEGYGGGKAVVVTSSSTGAPTVTLSKALEANKLYVFRAKVKGGAVNVWGGVVNNAQMQAAYTANGWAMYQFLVTPNDDLLNKTTFNIGNLYNKNTDPANNPVYFDDFELIEYYPGMNLMPAADGFLVPAPVGRGTSGNDFFANFISAGTTLSSVDDGTGNNVLKLTGVSAPSYNMVRLNAAFLNNNNTANNLLMADKGFKISYRYKSAVAGTDVTFNPITADNRYGTVSNLKVSEKDENGWITVSAHVKVGGSSGVNQGYLMAFNHSGAADIFVDDFNFSELTDADIDPTINIIENTATVEEGKTVTLNATVVPSGKTIEWTSSDDTIATVVDGVVTGVKAGEVTITAKVAEGVTDTCTVTVTEAVPETTATEIVLKDTTLHLVPGAYHILRPKAGAGGGQVGQVNWTSNATDVATVDATGKVTAVADGTAVITGVSATNPALTVTCTVTVNEYGNRLVGGDFEGETNTSIFTNYEPIKGGNAPDPADATNGVLKLNPGQQVYYKFLSGMLQAGSVYTISGRIKGSVSTGQATGAEFYINLATYLSGSATQWVTPTKGTDGTTWSEFSVTFVANTGVEAAYALSIKNHSTTTDAYYDDFKLVKRVAPELQSITVTTPNNVPIVELGSAPVTLIATAVPNEPDVLVGTLTWESSNTAVATIDAATGAVTAVAKGTTTITVKNENNKQGTLELKVVEPATGLVITDTALHLAPKAFKTLAVDYIPADAFVSSLVWESSNEDVATVDENGKVVAVADGVATITVKNAVNPDVKASITVTVDKHGNRIIGGDFESDFETNNWSNFTDDHGAVVEDPADATNHVLKLNPGKSAYYKFNDGLLEGNSVYIISGRVKGAVSTKTQTGVELFMNGCTLISGSATGWITPTLGADGETWSSFAVTFSVGANPEAAYFLNLRNWGSIDSYYDDIKLVKRVPPTVESITLSAANNAEIIALGDAALTLTAATTPNQIDVVVGELTWTSSNPAVATVSKTGALTADVTAVGVGETTITVGNAAGVSATYKLKVMEPATAIDITENTYTFGPEGMHKLTVNASPAGTYYGNLEWTSSNSDIVSVENGIIKGISAGTAIIKATSAVNPSVYDEITVIVEEYGEMLVGGDFEGENDLGHWDTILDPDGKAGGNIVLDPDDPNNHVLSFKINPSPNSAYYQYAGSYKLLRFAAQTTYVLTGRIKGNDKPAIGLNGSYVEHTATSNTAQWNYPEGSKEEWKEFKLVFKTNGSAPESLGGVLSFGNFGVGVCLFDDLKLQKQPPQTITGLTMLKETATYGVGVTTQINYTTTPQNADLSTLQWSSSNEDVATVDENGKVTTLAAGKTTITLKASDEVKATCELTVVADATSFVLSKTALTLIPGATDTLITVSTPYGAAIPGTLTWSSSDNNVATVANGVVTAVADGVATITCTNGTLSASCTVKVSAYGELIIGGDFQDETLPDNWASLVNGTAAEVVADPLVDGNKYLVVKAGQTTAAYTGLTLEADQLYLLTLRAKGFAATVNVNAGAVASFYPSDEAARKTKNDANKWNTLTLRFRTKASGTLSDVLSFVANAYGDTYIDDISLVKVPALTGISLSADSNEIAPGNSLQLTAKPVPSDSFIEGKVTWLTSDDTVLTVSDAGRLLAGKEGDATITAMVEGFAPATIDFNVNYYAPLLRNGDFADSNMEPWWSTKDATKVTQFEIREGIGENGSNGLQIVGKQGVYYNSLDMVLIPNNVYKMTVRYKSNTIALQNQRIWTNFGPGINLTNTKGEWKTIEKVFTVPASWLPSGYQASILSDSAPTEEWEEVVIDSIDVRMYDSGVDATAAVLNPPETTLTPGQSLTYMLSTIPSDANTNFMTWASSNPDVVTVDNGTILAVGGGTATITATIPTSTGSVTAVATVTVEGEDAIIKNGSFDVEGDTSWTLTDATVKPELGINNSNALVFGNGSVATQTLTGMKAGTVYIARLRSYSIGQLGASIKIKSADGATTFFNSAIPTVAGWQDSKFEFAMPDNYDGSPVIFELAASGTGTSLYLDNVSITEGYSEADLIVSDIMWNDGATQMKPGTPVDFTVIIGNIGTEATKANRDIVVEIRVNTKTIRTFVHKGGILAEEMIALTTDPNDPWLAEEGELVISAHVNTTLTVLESNSKNNGTQSFIRVSDNILEAPQLALDGGFNSLTFSDDFDTANVDTKFTGNYGYKWYLTDLAGMAGDETDYYLTGNSSMVLEAKNMHHNWLLCTMDSATGAGWLGYTHGYLEYRTRFNHNPEPGYTGIKAPAIWSFPPEAIAPRIYPKEPGEVHVEMDWMEYWGDTYGNMHWTVTMHEQADNGKQWMRNGNSYGIKGADKDIGDGEWHTVGYRWEKGIVITYLDGQEVMRQEWGPDGANPPLDLIAGEYREDGMMKMDNQTNALILAATKGWPMEIDYIRVWQADGTVDAKPVVDTTFLDEHLSDENGNYFTEVTADNYEAIIDAMDAWLELDDAQQNAINALLVEKGGKEYGDLLFEAQTLLNTVEMFVSLYACDEYGEPYTTVDETNYDWILVSVDEWNAFSDVEREAINNKVSELCDMTFDEMLEKAAALNDSIGEGDGEGEEPGDEGDEPGTDGEEPGTDGEEPGTDGEEPGTDGEEPGTDDEDEPMDEDTFKDEVLTDEDGEFITDVTIDNIQDILDAEDDWENFTDEQKEAINNELKENGGKTFEELLEEAKKAEKAAEEFVSLYALDEEGNAFLTVDETNYEQILAAKETWDSLSDLERALINEKVKELCGQTFEELYAMALELDEEFGEAEVPSPEDGVPFPTVAVVGLFLGGAAMIAGKKRRDEEQA